MLILVFAAGQITVSHPLFASAVRALHLDDGLREEQAAAHGYYETLLQPSASSRDSNRDFISSGAPRGILFPPHSRTIYETEEFRAVVEVNNLGFRGTDFPAARPSARRVAVLGDSYTYGWGLNLEETWVKRLEDELRRRGLDVEVANLGRGGAHPLQYTDVARKAIPVLKPDLVVLAVPQGDDLAQIRELAEAAKGHGAPVPHPSVRAQLSRGARSLFPDLFEWFRPAKRADAITMVGGAAWKAEVSALLQSAPPDHRVRYARLDPEVKQMYENGNLNPVLLSTVLQYPARMLVTTRLGQPDTRALVAEMGRHFARVHEAAAAHGAAVLVVSLPYRCYVSEAGMRQTGRVGFEVDPVMISSSAADYAIHLAARQAGLPSYALTEGFRRADGMGVRLYYDFDGHLTTEGSALVAQLLSPIVADRLSP